MTIHTTTMRDCLIGAIYRRMRTDKNIYFLCADFGSPNLDALRKDFKDRFLNVGIAEQNLINISTGLALEGFTVYAYAIAPFLAMRAYEQIRVNLCLHAQIKKINVNLIGVGAGLSYDLSGPTHHCLEDLSIMMTLPNIEVFSPSDSVLTEKFFEYSLRIRKPKYLRLDSKPLPAIYTNSQDIKFEQGFAELTRGKNTCLISTGYMTHKAMKIARRLGTDIGVIDIFLLRPFDKEAFLAKIEKYDLLATIEEAFVNKGGLDALVSGILDGKNSKKRLLRLGFADSYTFENGDREYLHKLNNLGEEAIIKKLQE